MKLFKGRAFRDTRVAQSGKHPTLDSGSGHDLMDRGSEPRSGLRADNAETAWDSLSLLLCLPLTCSCMLSLKMNEHNELLINN